jgi:heat shock protein HslJ
VGDGSRLEGRTFLSQEVTQDGRDRPLVAGTLVRIELSERELRAHAGCNHLFGTIESTAGGTLVVSDMGGTEMGCEADRHAQDQWLVDLLTSSPSWSLDGDLLVLTSGTTTMRLLDRRVADPDRPLEGTRWLVDTIIQGDTAMSIAAEEVAELHFSDGEVTGFTGCNELSGTYRIDGDRLHLVSFVQTDQHCGPEAMVLEDAVLAIESSGVEYRVVAGRLTLTAPDGRGLGLHAGE